MLFPNASSVAATPTEPVFLFIGVQEMSTPQPVMVSFI